MDDSSSSVTTITGSPAGSGISESDVAGIDRDHPLPPEIWLLISQHLPSDDSSPLHNLILANKSFRGLLQPLLFTNFDLHLLASFKSDGGVKYFQSCTYQRRSLARLDFFSSPRLASHVRSIHLRTTTVGHAQSGVVHSIDPKALLYPLMEKLSQFSRLESLSVLFWPIDGFVIRHLFTTTSLTSLSIQVHPDSSPPDHADLDAIGQTSFRLKDLTIGLGFKLTGILSHPWWSRLLSPALHSIELTNIGAADRFLSHLASHAHPSASLPSLRLLKISNPPPKYLSHIFRECPALETLEISAGVLRVAQMGDVSLIPNGTVPNLTSIRGPWPYMKAYLNHPSIRKLHFALRRSLALPQLEIVHSLRPELTTVQLDLMDLYGSRFTEIATLVLSKFRSLENFILSVFAPITQEDIEKIRDLFFNPSELDPAPTLRTVHIAAADADFLSSSSDAITPEAISLFREKCPLLTMLRLSSSNRCFEWSRVRC
ncbi:hypothetical protein BXZ70DRAFT_509458 [Cristinia sonorae]|uniref:F-box domain-containing protein n=1 Tax=Cristinia sonorae TaxID=1940300 RepID=A0A8K0XTS4_9AGAR|nr:hypothetical protein BXZ70DRAFT_509458 [Cristinia sonorae]